MPKLTIDVNNEVLQQARKIAARQGTSIKALFGNYINAAINREPWRRNELYPVVPKR